MRIKLVQKQKCDIFDGIFSVEYLFAAPVPVYKICGVRGFCQSCIREDRRQPCDSHYVAYMKPGKKRGILLTTADNKEMFFGGDIEYERLNDKTL